MQTREVGMQTRHAGMQTRAFLERKHDSYPHAPILATPNHQSLFAAL